MPECARDASAALIFNCLGTSTINLDQLLKEI